MKTRKLYDAPTSKTLEITVEKALLIPASQAHMLGLLPSQGDASLEDRNFGGYWGGNDEWH